MKNFFVLLLALSLVITCLTACNSQEYTDPTISPTMVGDYVFSKDTEISFETIDLVSSYCEGSWDGSFISNDEHCASIIDGELWVDCQTAEAIPDMGPYEDCFWCQIVGIHEEGTWVYDRQLGTIELWNHGTRYEKICTSFKENYLTSVYILENCIVCFNKTELSVYSMDGYTLNTFSEVIDCMYDGTFVKFSNFSNENYQINGTGEEEKINTNYVRFPRKNVIMKESMDNLITFPYNQYWNKDWETCNFYVSDNFYYIDFYGDIYINNKLVGNVNLGISNNITEDGPNLLTSCDKSLYLNGTDLIIYEKGEEKQIDIPDGNGSFLWQDDTGTVILVYGSKSDDNTLLIIRDNEVKVISEKVSDAKVAYDTIYYMEGDTVYSLAWQDETAQPKLFVEGAYAVSERIDELEGAIVPNELNNMEEYGRSNLYSPYGTRNK